MIIYQSVTRTYKYQDSIAWVATSQKCVETTAGAIRDGKISSREVWKSIAPNLGQLVEYLMKRKEEGLKPSETTTSASQGRGVMVDAHDNQEGNTKKDNLVADKGALIKDPPIKEWSPEEKEEFKHTVEKLVKEVDGIYLPYLQNEAYTSGIDSSSIPQSEFTFLRNLTISQPEVFISQVYNAMDAIFPVCLPQYTHTHILMNYSDPISGFELFQSTCVGQDNWTRSTRRW